MLRVSHKEIILFVLPRCVLDDTEEPRVNKDLPFEYLRDISQHRDLFLRKGFIQTNKVLCVHHKAAHWRVHVLHTSWFHRTFPPLRRILPRQIAFLPAASTFRAKFHQRMPHKRRFRNAVNASPALA